MRSYLKTLRARHNISQTDLARQLGISQNYYCDIENYTRQKNMNMEMVAKLSSVLKISVSKIIESEMQVKNSYESITIHMEDQ